VIRFVVTPQHRYTLEWFLHDGGRHLRDVVETVGYDDVLGAGRLPAGRYVFCDIDRLTADEREAAARVHAELARARPARPPLNHPTRVMRRYELLRALFEAGINDFDVVRLTEARAPRRLPVFLRHASTHASELLTPLLRTAADVADATRALDEQGLDRDDILAIGFCDTADAAGVYRKYAAFVIGDRIVPRHLFFDRTWTVGSPALVEPDLMAEEYAYVRDNPHEAALAAVFRLARIEYGRVNYGLRDGRVQVWEINTNPVVTQRAGLPARRPAPELFLRRFEEALRHLDDRAA
jgi:hypothetical protein